MPSKKRRPYVPSRVTVGGQPLRFIRAPGLHDGKVEVLGKKFENLFGAYVAKEFSIIFDPEASFPQIKNTVLHELLEAVNDMYNLDLSHHQVFVLAASINDLFSQPVMLKMMGQKAEG